jgi:hypothetical protein
MICTTAENILEETHHPSNNFAMSRRTQKARKQRAAGREIRQRGGKLPASPAPPPQAGRRYWHFVLLVSIALLVALGIWRKERTSVNQQVVTGGKPQNNPPSASVPASNPLPPPGGFFNLPGSIPMAASPAPKAATPEPNRDQPPPANSTEAALMKEMRERLTRDAGDPQKIRVDVQWMRDQLEAGWSQEPPAQAQKHREETEQTARLLLSNASNRAAVLAIVPNITIDK